MEAEMDENTVRALGAILSRRDRKTLREIFVGLAVAKEFAAEGSASEFFEAGLIATDRELKLYPGYEEDAIVDVQRYAKELLNCAAMYVKMKKISNTLRGVTEIFGPEAVIRLVKGTGVSEEEAKKFVEENCKECEKEECQNHPSDESSSKLVH